MSAKVGRNLIQFNQIIFDSKHSCLCSIRYINFFKNIRNMIFYCSLTDIQRCCNLLIEHSVSNFNKHLQLSIRQTVDFSFVNISGYQSAVQCRYQTGLNISFSLHNTINGFFQFCGFCIFHDITIYTNVHSLQKIFNFIMYR